jgi:hypothetical protein
MLNKAHFFETAIERYAISQRRYNGIPFPWTHDKVYQAWRFCNVHREDDRTTVWFRENIREPLNKEGDKVKMARAAVIFRWFNRIETGEIIKPYLLGEWQEKPVRELLAGVTPVVTGAYIIKGPDGLNKLDGVLACIEEALPKLSRCVPTWGSSLEVGWRDLLDFYYLGRFMAYEIISDLRWTPILDHAEDIMTWANAGPGCARGLGWVVYDDPTKFNSASNPQQMIMLEYMRELLTSVPEYWPDKWAGWEMREVEHWLCEYDKYRRAAAGQKLKRRYK